MSEERGVVRPVPWPRRVAHVARSLAREGAWCWLDGEAPVPGEGLGLSYLGAASEVRVAVRGEERGFLRDLRSGLRPTPTARSGFSGGWIGLFGYEFGVALMGLPPASDAAPPALALHLRVVLVLDHASGLAELRGDSESEIDAWLTRHGASLTTEAGARAAGDTMVPATGATSAAWRRDPQEYRDQVAACLESIADGEAYVLCLTDRATVRGAVDPLELYLRMRATGVSARGAVIVAGERALVSASPERFLTVRGREVLTHPIKGTRPRGATPAADEALAAELRADPKERAENLMIVDLMRNDLSRVCEPGSVATLGFLRVETHTHVHQLVSTVAGRLMPGRDVFDVIESSFPGGSMTGAPKRRAVELLAALEGGPRGLYSGCFGWIGHGGDAELAMTIRSVELRDFAASAGTATAGAGGGITADSDPASEEAERILKAAPLLALLAP